MSTSFSFASHLLPKVGITIVRPYQPSIHARVFQVLSRSGLDMEQAQLIPAATPDDEAVRRVLASPESHWVLLVPFHGHRDSHGESVNGIQFLQKLQDTMSGPFRWRVLMPITSFASASVTLAQLRDKREGAARSLFPHILIIDTDELKTPSLINRIRTHIAAPPQR